MSLRAVFLVASVILFGIAIHFGCEQPFGQTSGGYALNGNGSVAANVAMVPNYVAGPAAFGFAIAGGLSILAAAMVNQKS